MEAEPAAAHPVAPALGDIGGSDAPPALKTEPDAETAQGPAAPAPADAAHTDAGQAGDAVKMEDAAQDGAEEEDEPGLPPLPSTVQLLQDSCGWTVNGRIEVRCLVFPAYLEQPSREGDGVCICCAAYKARCGIRTAALHAACSTICRGGSPRGVVHALASRVQSEQHGTRSRLSVMQSMCNHARCAPADCAPGAPKPSHATL